MAKNPLQQLAEHGQSVWLDFISRELVTTDALQRHIDDDNVTGLTSNPTIFEKAIAEGNDYDEQLQMLVEGGTTSPDDLFLGIAISDIQHACDTLRPVYDGVGGKDGFVSLEVLPSMADDTEATVSFAKRLWKEVDRPNLMVKIPATPAGIPAIERCIAAGVNVNVTLIFALSAHARVINAYLSGLEERHARGEGLAVHSVASFFVSRVDTAVDKLLEQRLAERPDDPQLRALLGQAAIANAQLAYELFEQQFAGSERFRKLQRDGAYPQRPLWASTSAKNPRYRDVLYAEALVGPDTVDTMPPQTIDAFRDHGIVDGDTVNADYAHAHRIFDELKAAGIDMEQVTEQLQEDGVASFAKSYESLVRTIAENTDRWQHNYSSRRQLDLGAFGAAIEGALHSQDARATVRAIWDHDPDCWKPGDPEHAKEIKNRLGWLTVTKAMRDALPRLLALQKSVRDEDLRDAVVLGMGGSSLAPEVFRSSFGSAAGQPTLHVLDTTDPQAIARVSASIDPRTTLFIVSSKSGGTVETLSHMAHFWEACRGAGIADVGSHFVCVTDPGTSLAEHAGKSGFRELFENPPDIGGRYSALSFFGLVPAAVAGIEIEDLLDRADAMASRCAPGMPGDLNPGLVLGTAMGMLHEAGRDKVTILASPRIANFGLWAEQLIAESTGKEGRGIVPIGIEPIAEDAGRYSEDRLFVVLDTGDDAEFGRQVATIRAAGAPMITYPLEDLYDLAAEFFRWEFATAVAGHHLHVDPFDQPNVQESKDNTKKVLELYARDGTVADGSEPVAVDTHLAAYSDQPAKTPPDALRALVNAAHDGDYVALMAYVDPTEENQAALQRLRVAIRDGHRIATTLGFGPRFLHSTGQLHKGGPNTGIFVQITADDTTDVEIPGSPFTFSVLKQAQARGDISSLQTHGRRVLRLHATGGNVAAAINELASNLTTAGAAH